MKPLSAFCITLFLGICVQPVFSQQVYDADNGVTASGSGTTRKVSLGGTLTGNTGINLSTYNLTLTGTGNVGIRTGSPFAPLHVYKNTSGNYNPVMILEDALNDGYVMFQMKGTGRMYHLGVGNAAESYFGLTNKFFIWDQNAALPRLVVDPTGNVGIGTTSPGNRLSIAGATAGTSGLQFTQLNNTATAGTGNGKVLSLDASGNVVLVNDVGGAGSVWPLTGSTGSNPTTHFLGTIDNQDLAVRTNNQERARFMSNGNVLIGTTTDNGFKMNVEGTINSRGLRLGGGENIYWHDLNTHISRTTGNVLELQEYTGAIRLTGFANLSVELKHPSYGNVFMGFPADKTFSLTHHSTSILTSSDVNGSTSIKLGAPVPQYGDNRGVDLYLFGGLGGNVSSGYDGGNVYIDGGVKGGTTKNNGNILIGTQQGNVGIGTATPGNRLSIAGATAGTSGLQFTQLNSSSTAVAGNGKVLGLDATGNVILVNDGGSGGSGWGLGGNGGTAPGTDFIGTTDAQPLVFKTGNVERLRILNNGRMLIGHTTDGGYEFDLNGVARIQSSIKVGSFAIMKGADVTTFGVHQGIRVDDAAYTPVRFQTSNQGGVSENFVFENAYGVLRDFYGSASIIRIKQGWGNPNTTGYNVATIRIDNEINTTNGTASTIRGIYYNPTVTNLGGSTHIAYENTTGANRLNTTSGNTLIGTSTDNGNKLQVNGTVWASSLHIPTGAGAGKVLTSDANGVASWQTASGGGTAGWGLTGNSSPGAGSFIGTTDATALIFKSNNIEGIRIGTNGRVGIGGADIVNGDYKLYVQGNVRARKVRVDAESWADYVFERNYQLLPLPEVEKYIQEHRHLPGVPSATEVAKEGVDVGDNQAVLLKKIEELTLYVIEQNKLLKQQQERIEVLEKKAVKKH